jgi:type IV fimbrial biogenesis protein FimT
MMSPRLCRPPFAFSRTAAVRATVLGRIVRGFTLIELLVVLTISAILLAVGVPMFQESIARMRTTDAASSLVASIDLARAEAIRRGQRVFLCRATSTAPTACASAGDWADGWVVWTNVPTGTTTEAEDSTDIDDDDRLQVQGSLGATGSRAVMSLGGTTPPASLTFLPDGRVTPAVNITVAYPSTASPLSVRCVRVAGMGAVSTTQGTCS